MTPSAAPLRVIAKALLALSGLLIIAAAVWLNWKLARETLDNGRLSLKRYVVVSRDIETGNRLDKDVLQYRTGWLETEQQYVATIKEATDKYAAARISADTPIQLDCLDEFVPLEIADKFVTVPVDVQSGHLLALRLGMRLQFASQERKNGDESENEEKKKGASPEMRILTTAEGGFLLVAVGSPQGEEADKATLAVLVEKAEVNTVMALSRGHWRPIISALPNH